jgi:hypothetical protein
MDINITIKAIKDIIVVKKIMDITAIIGSSYTVGSDPEPE